MLKYWPLRRNKKQKPHTRHTRERSRGLLLEQLESRELLTAITSITETASFNITGTVGEKPESKIWNHAGKWWGVFSDTVGSHLYRLDGTTWNKALQLSTDTSISVDAKSQGNVAHILFENNLNTKLLSLQYVPGPVPTYAPWSERPTFAAFPLSEFVEAATIDIDSTGRMWIAHDDQISAVISSQKSTIKVHYSDAPYTAISDPIILDPDIFYDDISSVIAMPGGKVGVFWSNQRTKQFGFRSHIDGTDPTVWTADEAPGAAEIGSFADDHINLKVASDGTLYAAMKTSYDLAPNPWLGIMVRRPNAAWEFHPIPNDLANSGKGTRANIQLNELTNTLIYSYDDDFNWAYRECSTVTFVCDPAQILLAVGRNATGSKQNATKEAIVLVSGKSTGGAVNGAIIKFNVPNSAPTVDAGPNQTIFAAQTASLKGYAEDDGLPDPPNAVTTTWTKVVGPGIVTFGNTSLQETTATFSAEGAYTLRLTASDGTLTSTDDISIIVGTTPANQPPSVTVGPDMVIGIAQSPLLDGTVVDDGLPFTPGTVSKQWSKISGPGAVAFATPTAEDTTVTFGSTGTYTLRLTAFDGQFTATDEMVVTVNLLPPNQAPVVNAGSDQTILIGSNATLSGSFTDDNQPIPSSSIATSWSKVSGPGVVSFLNPAVLNTAANFSLAGTYVLSLSASDTELIGQDTLTVSVINTPPSQTLSFQDGVLPTTAYAGTRDTKLRSDQATTNNGASNKLEVDGSPDFSSIMQWDVSSVPSDSVVTGASFTINVVNTTTAIFELYEVLKPWLETQTTFNLATTGVPWQVPGAAGATDRGSTILGTVTAPALGLVTVQLNAAGVAIVQKWVTTPATNNGLIIQDYNDAATDDVDFNSSEITTPTTRPKLVVSYTTIPVNDPPFIGNLAGDVLPYLENAGPQVIDQGTAAIVSDADSPDFAFGSLTLSMATGGVAAEDVLSILSAGDIAVTGSDVRYQGNIIGTVTGGTNGTSLIVSLNLAATPTALSALVRAVTYANLSHNPHNGPRTVSFALNDGDGTTNGGGDTVVITATVNVTAVNDPPVLINLEFGTMEYVENSGLISIDVDAPATVVDFDSADFAGGSLVVSLGASGVAAQDVLSILPTALITFDGTNVRFEGTTIGTVSGGTNGANLAIALNSSATKTAMNALLAALAYRNTSDAPTSSQRVVSFTINDGDGVANGGADTSTQSMTITVTPINDAPAINNLGGNLLPYVEGTGLQAIDQGTAASLTDLDSLNLDGGTLSVSITSGGATAEDILSVKHVGSSGGQIGFAGNTVSFEGTGIGTATGGANGSTLIINLNNSATIPAVSAMLAAIAYNNSSNTPSSAQRLVSFVITDGDGTAEGGSDTATVTTTIGVTANNDPPVINDLSGDVLAYTESSGAKLLDQGTAASVADVDSTDFAGGSVTVSVSSGGDSAQDVLSIGSTADISLDGTNVKFQGTTVIGTVAGGTNGVNLVVNLNSSATPGSATALLRSLIYANTSVAPTTNPRTITIAINDGDGTANGGADTSTATVTINIAAINSAPAVGNLNGDSVSYIEDTGAQRLDQAALVTVSDDDSPNFDTGTLTASVAAGGVAAEDILAVLSAGDISISGSTVSHLGTVFGTMAGGSNGSSLVIGFNSSATPASVSALLHAITYTNTSNTPNTTQRQITLVLNDGDGTANGGTNTTVSTVTINITSANDAPAINNFGGNPLSYLENAGAQVINQAVNAAVTDVDSADFAGGSLTVSILSGGSAAQDVLSIRNVGDISFAGAAVSHQTAAIGTVSGGTNGAPLVISLNSSATAPVVSALLHALSYANVSQAPTSTTRIVTLSLRDGDGMDNGGADTGTATATVNVTAVNDAPVLTNLNGGASFTEGGSSVVVDADVTLTDFELAAANNYAGASLSVARQGGSNTDDVFSFHVGGTPGFTVGAGDLKAGGSTFATFENTAGALSIQFVSGSTSALVNDVLQRIVYANAGVVLPASVTLLYTVSDGNSGNVQGTGGNPATATGTATVAINTRPVLTNLNGGATYLEDGLSVQVDTDVLVADAELDALNNYSNATLTVVRQGGSHVEDVISLSSGSVILTGSNVMVGGNVVATLSAGPGSSLSLSFNGIATSSIADEVLQAVTYANASQNPPSSVTLAYTFHDGSAQVSGTATVNITAVNDAPTISNLNGDTLSYLENAGSVAIDQGLAAVVVSIDSPDFDSGSLTVAIATGGVPTEDVLSIRTTGGISVNGADVSHLGSVIGTAAGGSGGAALVISLNSLATQVAVSALLQAIAYKNTSDVPSTAQRSVTFTLNDGDGVANGGVQTSVTTATINITSVNDAPVLSNLAGDTLTYTENSGAHVIDQTLAASVGDVDSVDFASGSLTASLLSGGVAAQDVLSIQSAGDIGFDGTTVRHLTTAIGTTTGGTNGVALVITLNSSATAAAVSALLNAITYANISEAPTTTARVVTFSLKDGDGVANGGIDTGTATATVNLTAVNDAPVLTGLNGGGIFNESGSPVVIDQDATVTDLELAAANNYAGASLSVSRQGGSNPDDVLSFQTGGTPGFTVGAGVLQSGGSTFATFTNSAGVLTIQFGSGSTTALVNEVLQRMAYSNAGGVLPTGVILSYTVNDGNSGNAQGTGDNPATVTGTATVTFNKLPVLTNLNGGATYMEDGPSVSVDLDVVVSDQELDGLNSYAGSTLTVTRQGGTQSVDVIGLGSASVTVAGSNVTVGGIVVATLSQGPGSTLSLSFNANATSSIADEVLQAVTYANMSQNPPSSVTLGYTFHDGSTQVSGTATVLITVVNDAPEISHLSTLEYLENSGAQVIDQGTPATATDIDSFDFGGGSLTVSFMSGGAAAEDALSIRTAGSISFDGVNVSYLGFVIGAASGGNNGSNLVIGFNNLATPAAVSALLNAVTYRNISDVPSMVQRLVTFTLIDGDGSANFGTDTFVSTATINITAVNDAPVLSQLAGNTLAYTENAGAQVIDQPLAASVSDVDSADFAGGTLTVSISSGGVAAQDVLSIRNTGDIGFVGTTVSYQGTTIGSATGGTNGDGLLVSLNSSSTAPSVSALLNAITYANISDAPTTTSRVVAFSLTDGDGLANGGADTGTATATINITAVNDAPQFVDLNSGSVFNEGGSPVAIDSNATIADPELDAANNYGGAALTIARNAGQNLDDVFGFDTSGTPTFTLVGSELRSGGLTFATFTHTLGLFFLNFTSSGTPATAMLVDEVLQRITYRNNGTSLPTSVVLFMTLSDGNAGAQGTGAAPGTDTETPTITINKLPVLANLNGGTTYTENGPAVLVDEDIVVSDLELDTLNNYVGASLTVTRQGGASASDVISLGSALVTVGGSDVIVGSTVVATLSQGPGSTLSVDFNGNATSGIADQVLQAVTYANTDNNPLAGVTLLYSFSDGVVATIGSATMSITAVNDAPLISNLSGDDLGYIVLTSIGNAPPQVIDQGAAASVSDVDSINFDGGNVTVALVAGGVPTEDSLSIRNAGTGSGQIGFDGTIVRFQGVSIGTATGGTNGYDLVVTLNPAANSASVSALLSAITYENTSATPDVNPRTVVFSVKDGDGVALSGADTGTATATITLRPINDPPVISNLAGDNLQYTENSSPQRIDQGIAATIVDPDSANFGGGFVNVSIIVGAVPAEDVLSISDHGAITFDGSTVSHSGIAIATVSGGANGSALVISLNNSATVAAVAQLLAAINYANTSNAPSTAARQVLFTLNDGDGTMFGGTDTTTVTTTVTNLAVNDAPVLSNVNGSGVFSSGAAPIALDTDATVTDIELAATNNFGGASITVARHRGANPDDSFGFTSAPNFIVSGAEMKSGGLTFATYTNVEGTLTVSFSSSQTPATPALVNEVLQHIYYQNVSPILPLSVVLAVTVSDGNTGNAQGTGLNPATHSANAFVQVNYPPVLLNLNGGGSYMEDGPAVAVDTNALVADPEMDSMNDYTGASLSATVQSGVSGQEALSLGSAWVTVVGANVNVGGVTVANVTQGPGTTLSVVFNSNSTSASADRVLQAVTYANSSQNLLANAVIDYQFSDASGVTLGSATVALIGVNDAPAVSQSSTLTYTENSGPQRIDHGNSAIASDVDSPDFANGSLTASISSGGAAAQDVLSIQHAGGGTGQIGFDGTNVSFEGTGMGTSSGGANGQALVIQLNGFATAASVSALMRSISYENTSEAPNLTQRIVTFALNDGDGTANGGTNTGSTTAVVNLIATNDAPVIVNLDGDTLSYTEGVGPQQIDQGIVAGAADVDSLDFGGGSLVVSFVSGGISAEDAVSIQASGDIGTSGSNVTFQGTIIGTMTGGANGVDLVINLTGSATVPAVSALIRMVSYVDTSSAPSTGPRTITFTLNDGDGVDVGTATTSVEFTAVNDAPNISHLAGDVLTYTENSAPMSIDVGIAAVVQDIDSHNFDGGSLTVSVVSGIPLDGDVLAVLAAGTISVDGANVLHQGSVIGTASGGSNGSNLVIGLNALATPTTVSALLQAISYQNTSDAPPTSRQIAVTLVDGDGSDDGGADTATVTTTVNVVSVNDAPFITALNGDVLAFTENASTQAIDQGAAASVSDLDSVNFEGGLLTVSITSGNAPTEDVLAIRTGGTISVVGGNVQHLGTVIGSYSGGGNGADLVVNLNGFAIQAAVAALMGAVTYGNASDAPNANVRTVSFSLNDGDGVANGGVAVSTVTAMINLTAINDAPVVSDLNGDALNYVEGSGTVTLDQGTAASVSDVDSLDLFGGSLTVTFLAGGVPSEDVLSVVPLGEITLDGVDVRFQGTSFGTFGGGVSGSPLVVNFFASATSASVSALLRAVAFTNTSNSPSTQPRTVSWTVNDGDGTLNGGANTGTVTTTINLLSVNAAPVINQLDGDTLSYVENSGPQLIDQGTAPSVSDGDSTDFAGGSLSVSFTSGSVPAEDRLSVRNAGIGSGQIGFNGTTVSYGGVSVGSATGGTNGANLVVLLNNFATPTSVAALLAAVTFEHISENPDANPRVVSFTLTDGDGAANGGADSTTATATVNITAVNDAPVISNLNGDLFSYTENSGAVAIDHGLAATVSLSDSPDFAGGSLTVSITSGGVVAEDVLSILSAGDIGLNGSDVNYQGTTIGSVTGGSNLVALAINFNSSATPISVSALLRAVAYANSSSTPNTIARQVTFSLNDGDGTANGGVDTNAVTATVSMLPVNAPPVLINLDGDTLSYMENAGVQVIDQAIAAAVSDSDSANFADGSLTVAVISGGAAAQDLLSIRNAGNVGFVGTTVSHLGTAIGTASGGTNGAALVISLNSSATPGAVSALLNAITYANHSEAPTPTARVVTFSLNDGDGVANGGNNTGTATATINVTAVNDLPVLTGLNGTTFTQGGAAVVVDSNVTIADLELALANDYSGASLSIARQGGANVDDVMTFNLAGTPGFTVGAGVLQSGSSDFATFSSNSGALSVHFGTGSTSALVDEVVQRIAYFNAGSVLPVSVNLLYTVTDGNNGNSQGTGDNPGIVTGTAIVAINHLPVLTNLNGGATYLEDGLPVIVDTDALVSDVELDALNNYAGATLTVTRQGGTQIEDVIGLSSASVTLTGSNVIVGGNVVATLSQGPGGALSFSFNGNATSAIANQVLQAVTYASTNQNPPLSVSLAYTFHDGAIQVGGAAPVNITGVNDAPVVNNLNGDTLAYFENTGAVSIDQGLAATIVQIDSPDFDGGSLTVSITTGGVTTEDVLSVRTAGAISVSGVNVSHSGTVIGTVSGGSSGTPLVVNFNGSATPTAVAALLNTVGYANTADVPSTIQRLATFTLNDGDGVANLGSDTSFVTATINVTPVNDPPVVSNLGGDVLAFMENAVAQVIDQATAASVTDADSLDFATGSLTVSILSGGVAAQDVLAILNAGSIGISGTTVSHLGTAVGTFTGGTSGAALVISLNSSATAASVSALLGAITYANVSEAPSITARLVTFSLNDGDGVLNGGVAVGTATATVNITAVNDAPIINNLNGDVLAYTEATGPKKIDQGVAAQVTDVDSPDFATGSLTVAITTNGVAAQDVLSIQAGGNITISGANVSHLGTVMGTVAGGTGGNNLVVSLNSAATLTAVTALIGAVNYQNTSTTPSVNPRTVTFTLRDGDGTLNGGFDAATATTTISITAVDTPNSLSFQNGVFPTTGYSGTQDTKVRADQATGSFGTSGTLEMDGAPDITSFIKWDVTGIPSGSVVQSASLTINVVNTSLHVFNLYQLVRSWSETTATFNVSATGVPWQVAGAQGATDRGTTVLGTVTSPALGSVTINLNSAGVAVVQSWVNNSSQNFGLVFQNFVDASTDDLDFSSKESTNALLRPKLTVAFAPAPGQSASFGGSSLAMTNPTNPFDVNNDTAVSPLDALIVINQLNLAVGEESHGEPAHYPDVTGDGRVAPLDVLIIINYLNQFQIVDTDRDPFTAGAEGEGFTVGDKVSAPEPASLLQAATDGLTVAGIWFGDLRTGETSPHDWQRLTNLDSDDLAESRRELSADGTATWSALDLDECDPIPSPAIEHGDDVWSLELQSTLEVISEDLLAIEQSNDAMEFDGRSSVFAGWPCRGDDDETDQ